MALQIRYAHTYLLLWLPKIELMNSRFTGNSNAKISSQTSQTSQTSHPAASQPAGQPFPDSIFLKMSQHRRWEAGPLTFVLRFLLYVIARPHFIQISRASPVLGFRGSSTD